MQVFNTKLAFIASIAIAFAGCSSSKQETAIEEQTSVPYKNISGSTGSKGSNVSRERQPVHINPTIVPEQTISWKPHFIATGLASGIMAEFTGMKKDKPMNAKFASIELVSLKTSSAKTYMATINSLRQAFFEIPPGNYIVRQVKTWAEQTRIQNVEVKDGHYSVIYIGVINPRASKLKDLSQQYRE